MSVQLVAEVTAFLNRDECELTPSERVALYAVADRARDNTRQAWQGGDDDWRLERVVGVKRLPDVLERLAERGFDIRVVVKIAENGRPIYAHKGRQVSYLLPPLDVKASDGSEPMASQASIKPDLDVSKDSDESEAYEAKASDQSHKASDGSHKASDGSDPKQSETVNNKEPKKTSRPRPEPYRADVDKICTHLADLVEANGSKRPNITDKWRREARLLLDEKRKVPVTVEKVVRLLGWVHSHPFWKSNILSMPKFREKYDTLRLQANEEWKEAKDSKNGSGHARPSNGFRTFQNYEDPNAYDSLINPEPDHEHS